MKISQWIAGVFLGIGVAVSAQAQSEVVAGLTVYEKVDGVAGNLNSIGSDTLNNLMTYWAEEFRKLYPNVNIQIEGKGSSTAPPALMEGTAQLGPMSRKMKDGEMEGVEKKVGYKPTAIVVAFDALTVYVNKDNPMTSMSLPQVDAVFSKTRKSEYQEDIVTWGQLGLPDKWAGLPISLYGRNAASGTYGFFKKKALYKGDYKDTVKEQPGSASVVLGVTEDKAGVGYSGIGYVTSGVKAIALSKTVDGDVFEPSYDNVLQGKYPLGRSLYVYILRQPGKPISVLQEQFLRLVLSKVGQEIVVKDGYLPLPASVAAQQLELLAK